MLRARSDAMWNKNEQDGKIDQAKGKAKETIGNMTNDPALSDEGRDDQAAGKIEEGVGRAQRKVGEAVENVGKAIKR
jgi:uncharacterized protein YjbJ (UPF0337 family)